MSPEIGAPQYDIDNDDNDKSLMNSDNNDTDNNDIIMGIGSENSEADNSLVHKEGQNKEEQGTPGSLRKEESTEKEKIILGDFSLLSLEERAAHTTCSQEVEGQSMCEECFSSAKFLSQTEKNRRRKLFCLVTFRGRLRSHGRS
jgi:hypothetical protein